MTNSFSLSNFQNPELKKPETVIEWRKTIVFAPHPDDESLGCGGAIALLRKYDVPVRVIAMSDGTLSHPNSVRFPAEKLRELREKEMKNALEILGVTEDKIRFLRYRDRCVPGENDVNFFDAVETVKNILSAEKPQTIFAPWRLDPHPDHRATWQLVRRAIDSLNFPVRLIEYPIWLYELATENDLPVENEIQAWRLDIARVVQIKQTAIRAHESQVTGLIDDDPQGFRLSAEILEHFRAPFEIYLEEKR